MDERKNRPLFSELFLPGWENKARNEYISPLYPDTETNFTRGNRSIQMLHEYNIISRTDKTPTLLFVGLGLEAYPLECCYQPFRLAAHFDAKNYQYRMDLIDISAKVIQDIRERKKLYLYKNPREISLQTESWEMYLDETNQHEYIVNRQEEGMVFCDGITPKSIFSQADYLRSGISRAKVPKNFHKNVNNGKITLQTADIATTQLPQRKYDYVELLNVLYQLQPSGQKLALNNVASSMRSGSLLLLNDIGPSGIPLLKRFGGWLDRNNIQVFNLQMERVLDTSETSEIFLVRKK